MFHDYLILSLWPQTKLEIRQIPLKCLLNNYDKFDILVAHLFPLFLLAIRIYTKTDSMSNGWSKHSGSNRPRLQGIHCWSCFSIKPFIVIKEPWATPDRATPKSSYPFKKTRTLKKKLKKNQTVSNNAKKNSKNQKNKKTHLR